MNQESAKKQIIANRLAEARKMAGLSQGQVARMIGLHRPAISEIEAGHRNVTAIEIAQFAKSTMSPSTGSWAKEQRSSIRSPTGFSLPSVSCRSSRRMTSTS